jgi:hypothetical protein
MEKAPITALFAETTGGATEAVVAREAASDPGIQKGAVKM